MIIVTGASKGLGAAIVNRLEKKGIKTLSLARKVNNLNTYSISCDVSDYEQVKSVSQIIKKKHINVTGLINAAGVASMNLAIMTPNSITQKLIQVNLIGTIYCCQLFAPLIIKNKGGRIINFSTIAVALGLKGESVYVASKAGVEGFSRSFAREMSDFNINVNCLVPGPIDTDLIKGVNKSVIEKLIKTQIIPKKFNTDDVSDLVELLLDNKSKSLSGQVLNIGGI